MRRLSVGSKLYALLGLMIVIGMIVIAVIFANYKQTVTALARLNTSLGVKALANRSLVLGLEQEMASQAILMDPDGLSAHSEKKIAA